MPPLSGQAQRDPETISLSCPLFPGNRRATRKPFLAFYQSSIFLNLAYPKTQAWIPAQGRNEEESNRQNALFSGKRSAAQKPFLHHAPSFRATEGRPGNHASLFTVHLPEP